MADDKGGSGGSEGSTGSFKAFNYPTVQLTDVAMLAPPGPPAPIHLAAVRNGAFAAQVIVIDNKPIRGLQVEVTDLSGPQGKPGQPRAAIPAAAVGVRYAVPNEAAGTKPASFDALEESAPAEVPVFKERSGAIQPIWITVAVPTGAGAAPAAPAPGCPAGDYTGQVTITAAGVSAVNVPLTVKLFDWTLPPPQDYGTRMDYIQSPESVALAYNLALWSDDHLKMLDKTFALLAPLACKTVYVTCIRRTHFGNEHAMVHWVLGDDGELTPEFSVVEKYLDVAIKRLGKVPGVILYCWEPPESGGHAGGTDTAARLADRPILITVADPKTGELSAQAGPAWGTPESKEFWKKLTDGIVGVLKKRGLEKSMMFGLAGDWRPTQQAMDDISNAVPGARWAGHSHIKFEGDNNKLHGYEMGMASILWGINLAVVEPNQGLCFGWSNPFWLTYFSRNEIHQFSEPPLTVWRMEIERHLGARPAYAKGTAPIVGSGASGLGRIGSDFWLVLKDTKGRARANLAGRYPESAWGQLNMNNGIPWILGKGKIAAVPTVRSEAFREGLQECEARIYLEKAWLDDAAKAMLGDDLRGRIRTALDERIHLCCHLLDKTPPAGLLPGPEWDKRTELLFTLAGEVATKYAGKDPQPNLKVDAKKN